MREPLYRSSTGGGVKCAHREIKRKEKVRRDVRSYHNGLPRSISEILIREKLTTDIIVKILFISNMLWQQ